MSEKSLPERACKDAPTPVWASIYKVAFKIATLHKIPLPDGDMAEIDIAERVLIALAQENDGLRKQVGRYDDELDKVRRERNSLQAENERLEALVEKYCVDDSF